MSSAHTHYLSHQREGPKPPTNPTVHARRAHMQQYNCCDYIETNPAKPNTNKTRLDSDPINDRLRPRDHLDDSWFPTAMQCQPWPIPRLLCGYHASAIPTIFEKAEPFWMVGGDWKRLQFLFGPVGQVFPCRLYGAEPLSDRSAFRNRADRFGQCLTFQLKHSLLQRFGSVILEYWARLLQQNPTVIILVVDDVDGATGNLYTEPDRCIMNA
jgi:hypothetical protein